MNNGINEIEIIFDDGDKIELNKEQFSHFYISNIDDDANEKPYEKLMDSNNLYANFVTLKVNSDNYLKDFLLNNQNIAEIKIVTTHEKKIGFNVASTVDPFKRSDVNDFNKSFMLDDAFCLLICPYDLKYKKNLFI